MPDDKWLEMCGRQKWVAFSHDRKFHAIEVEALAIRQHHVAAFTLCGANEPTWHKLGYFVKAYAKIAAIVVAERPPYLYRLHKNLALERVKLP